MGIRKSMSGVSWHIEKKVTGNKTHRNCYNCKYLNVHWCEKNRIQVTNNNAPICKAYTNKHVINKIQDKTKEQEDIIKEERVITHNNTIRKSELIRIRNQMQIIPTSLYIKTNEHVLNSIIDNINKNDSYHFRGFIDIKKDMNNVIAKDITSVVLITKYRKIRCKVVKNSLEMIKSGKSMTLSFIIESLNENSDKPLMRKPVIVLEGIDNFYVRIRFCRSEKNYRKYKNKKRMQL